MNDKKKNGWIVFLVVWFIWATGSDFQALVRFNTGTDYFIFQSAGVPWAFFVLAGLVAILDFCAVWYLLRPSRGGHFVIVAAMAMSAIYTAISWAVMSGNLDAVRDAYAISREARGLEVRPEAMEKIFSSQGLAITHTFGFVAYLAIALIGWLNKAYFRVANASAKSGLVPEYPNDSDGNALRRVAEEGSDMSQPMTVDFNVLVPDERAGQEVAAAAEANGFRPSLERDEESGYWTCYCSKEMIATYEAVIEAQRILSQVSGAFGGQVDGWGTYGNAR